MTLINSKVFLISFFLLLILSYSSFSESYSITYFSNNATAGSPPLDKHSYKPGKNAIVLDNATLVREGYAFQEWCDSESNTLMPGDNITITNMSISLYPVWKINNYTLSLIKNDESKIEEPYCLTLSYKTRISLPNSTFTKDGFMLVGWSFSPDGSYYYKINDDFVMPAKNYNLYAVWVKNQKITFDKNEKSANGTMMATTGPIGNVKLPKCTFWYFGYKFIGWADSKDGSIKYIDEDSVTSNNDEVVLYAKWAKQENDCITLGLNGNVSKIIEKKFSVAQVFDKREEVIDETITRQFDTHGFLFFDSANHIDRTINYINDYMFKIIDHRESEIIELSYNQDRLMSDKVVFDAYGSILEKVKYLYDSKFRKIEEMHYFYEHQVKYNWNYNPKDQLVDEICIDSNNVLISKKTYNSQGLLVRFYDHYKNIENWGGQPILIKYTYNNSGKLLETDSYLTNEDQLALTLIDKTVINYDKNNCKILEQKYFYYTPREFYPVKVEIIGSSEPRAIITSTFSDKGLKIDTKIRDEDYGYKDHIIYTYDEFDNMLTEFHYSDISLFGNITEVVSRGSYFCYFYY